MPHLVVNCRTYCSQLTLPGTHSKARESYAARRRKKLDVSCVENLHLTFFFQAEDGIRDVAVTRVQTCALPISGGEKEGGTCVAGSCPHRGARAATNGYPDLEGR